MPLRSLLIALLAAAAPVSLAAAPTPKEQLLVPPATADHFVVVSEAGKHGDEWRWRLPDGSIAYRESILLRGFIFETDQVVTLGPDGMPAKIQVRGITPSGDAAESFAVEQGVARWTSPVDKGSVPYKPGNFYITSGGTFLAGDLQLARLVAAGAKGLTLLPGGKGVIEAGPTLSVTGAKGPRNVRLMFVKGVTQTPQPIWVDEKGEFFAFVSALGILPAGYEQNLKALEKAQDEAVAAQSPVIARRFLTAAARAPVLFDGVKLYDAEAQRFLADRAVLVENGKISAVGAAGSIAAPEGARTIAGAGRTLVPGLWDSHMHMGNDWSALSELAIGVTSYRDPGTTIELAQSQRDRRAAGTLLSPEGFSSIIIDRKNPLAAQASLSVTSGDEAIAAVRRIKASGMWGVKFYTSMTPEWIAPAAAEAHKLGLHVHGHVPATMRARDAIEAGYDEITHINFVLMQALPDEVVNVSNTAARFSGPARFGKDVDLDAEPMRSLIAEMARRKTAVDPTVATFEVLLAQEAGEVAPAYAAFIGTLPPATERGFKSGGFPLEKGYTRADYRKSIDKMAALAGKLHQAGVPIVAGTDGTGLELIRELELYVKAGLTPAQALSTATIAGARLVGVDSRTGSIAVGKEADLLLVEGDVERDISALRRVNTVVSDGVVMDGDALRAAAGFSGMPK